jgi:hypothetical protein
VELILSEDPSKEDIKYRDKLLLPYKDMGMFFPDYELYRPRENI